jgi:threonine/homoserine/homoserine lactone efflux protein
MNILNILSLAISIFILASIPGIGVATTLSCAVANGFKSASLVVLGIVFGDIVYLLIAIYGLGFIAKNLAILFIFVKYIGGLYLIYLGYKIFNSNSKVTINSDKIGWRSNFASGFLITLSNPKVILFYLSFLPAFIDLQNLTYIDTLLIVLTVSITLASVLLFYAYMVIKVKNIFNSKGSNLNRVSGAVMMGAGGFLIVK